MPQFQNGQVTPPTQLVINEWGIMAIKVDVELNCEKLREQLREVVRELVEDVLSEHDDRPDRPEFGITTSLCPNSQKIAVDIARLIYGSPNGH
jgi:hypothetical protein